MIQIKTYGAEETRRLGGQFARLLAPGDCVGLTGDLGAGKTALVGGMCAGLGISDTITSPTFTLMHRYAADPPVFHFDCFRLKHPGEIAATGFDELVGLGQSVLLVEWADRISDYFSDWTYEIALYFDQESAQQRLIQFSTRRAGRSKKLFQTLSGFFSEPVGSP